MKTKYLTIITALVFLLCNCVNKNKGDSLNQPSMSNEKLKELALMKGDTIAYHEMSIAYMDSPNDDDFIVSAMTMAEKYKFHTAYLDVYYCLTDYYHRKDYKDLDDLDYKTREKAIKYLRLGDERGDKECKKLLGNYYIQGKYVTKNIQKGKNLIKEGEKY